MGVFIGKMKVFSLWMLEPPWRHSGPAQWEKAHWLVWFVGSVWSLAGLVLGAVVAPSLVQSVGHLATPYQGALVTGVAVLAGFLVQSLGWLLLVPTLYVVVLIWGCPGFVEGRKRQVTTGRCSKASGER